MDSASTATTAGATPRGHLLKILGVGFGVAVTLGGVIGIGILRTPGLVAAQTGSAALVMLVWLLGGVYALFGTLALAELGTSVPRSGGYYVFARRAFGEYPGFVVGWTDWISLCSSQAAVAVAVGEFSAILWPRLGHSVTQVALTVQVGLAALHWAGLRISAGFQELSAFVKALAYLALIAACFLFVPAPAPAAAAGAAPGPPASIGSLAAALVISFQAVLFTYSGWDAPAYFSEENRDTGRDLPRGMILGVLAVIAIYLLFNLALLHALPFERLAGSKLAATDAAELAFGSMGGRLITALSVLSALTAINPGLFQATRVLYALAVDRVFTRRAAYVNARGTPVVAMFASSALAMSFVATGTFEWLVAITAFFYVLNYGIGFAALFALRRREPGMARPFRAWGYPWTTGIVLTGSFAFLAGAVASDTRNSLFALVILLASYPCYRLTRRMW